MNRIIDIIASLFLCLLLVPAFVIIALSIQIKLGSPIIFSQIRPGLGGRPFRMIKFRSMSNVLNVNNDTQADAARLSRFGHFLRASSLDELPELWNVLKGDMSLVGPRPLLMEYLPLYSTEQARRHSVRPGITGWAQVNGRNSLSWDEKFALDIWYVDNRSMFLDIKILLLTSRKVILRDGISAQGEATMPAFTGSTLKKK